MRCPGLTVKVFSEHFAVFYQDGSDHGIRACLALCPESESEGAFDVLFVCHNAIKG
jgi:hypothetical protein